MTDDNTTDDRTETKQMLNHEQRARLEKLQARGLSAPDRREYNQMFYSMYAPAPQTYEQMDRLQDRGFESAPGMKIDFEDATDHIRNQLSEEGRIKLDNYMEYGHQQFCDTMRTLREDFDDRVREQTTRLYDAKKANFLGEQVAIAQQYAERENGDQKIEQSDIGFLFGAIGGILGEAFDRFEQSIDMTEIQETARDQVMMVDNSKLLGVLDDNKRIVDRHLEIELGHGLHKNHDDMELSK